jgi:rRNA maturation protein Rpf1
MREKATAAHEYGAAVVAIVIEQNGNAASVMHRKCARGAYRFCY